jgi:putative sterol carrier protein
MPFVVGKRVAPPDGTTVLFTVVGVMGRKLFVRVDGGRAAPVAMGPDDEPTVTLTMDQEAFWRLGFGRVEPARVIATGEVRIDGDVALGHRVLDSMAFMI